VNMLKVPILYIYDHCPFSNRSRLILGLKDVEYELRNMESADVATPTALIGSKQAPILQFTDGHAIGESMDIVRHVDQNWGGEPILAEASGRKELKDWIDTYFPLINKLVVPRYVSIHMDTFALSWYS